MDSMSSMVRDRALTHASSSENLMLIITLVHPASLPYPVQMTTGGPLRQYSIVARCSKGRFHSGERSHRDNSPKAWPLSTSHTRLRDLSPSDRLKDDRAEAEATMIGTQAEKCETDQGSGSGSPTKVEGKTTPRAKGKGRISVKDEGAVALPPSKKTQKCPPKRKTHSSEEETEISGAPDPSDNDVKPAATGRRRKKQRAVSGHGQASKENGRATAKQKVKVEESEPSTDVASDEESREEDNDAATSEEEVMPKKNRAKEGSARGSSGRGPLRGFGRGRSRGKTIKVRKEWPGG